MTNNPIPLDGFPRTGRPWNNITPFTYRDGLTYLEVLEALRHWVRTVLVPHIDSEMVEVVEHWENLHDEFEAHVVSVMAEWQGEYDDFTANIQALVDQWTSTQIENNDVITEQILSDPESATREALDAIIETVQIENSDVVTEQVISDPESATREALYNVIAQRMPYINIADHGAVGDGVADDTLAIQSAFDAAGNSDTTVIFPVGTYRAAAPLTAMCNIIGDQATINYEGLGSALTLGQAGTTLARRKFDIPRLVCRVNIAQQSWSATPIQGLRAINLNGCVLKSTFIRAFDEGLVCEGNGGGFVHTDIHPGVLWQNRAQYTMRAVNTAGMVNGYIGSNVSQSGRCQIMSTPEQSSSSWGISGDPLAYALALEAKPGTGAPNAITVNDLSVEGANADQYRIIINGSYNQLNNVRYEPHGDVVRLLWGERARFNRLNGGYALEVLEEVFEDGSTTNTQTNYSLPYYVAGRGISDATVVSGTPLTLASWNTVLSRKATVDNASGQVTPRQGRWRFMCKVHVSGATGATGTLTLSVRKNGSAVDFCRQSVEVSTVRTAPLYVEVTDYFSGQDVIDFAIETTSSDPLDVVSTSRFTHFHGEYLAQ